MSNLGAGRLGDAIHAALAIVGITTDRVERWVGAPCGCQERIDKLNRLGRWAVRIVAGKRDKAEQYLDEILNEPQ